MSRERQRIQVLRHLELDLPMGVQRAVFGGTIKSWPPWSDRTFRHQDVSLDCSKAMPLQRRPLGLCLASTVFASLASSVPAASSLSARLGQGEQVATATRTMVAERDARRPLVVVGRGGESQHVNARRLWQPEACEIYRTAADK